MEPRIDCQRVAPGALQAMSRVEQYARDSGLEHSLLELVKIRASPLNRCAYCLDMHTKGCASRWRDGEAHLPRE